MSIVYRPAGPDAKRGEGSVAGGRAAIGIDVGGTKISAGIVTFPSGKLLFKQGTFTRAARGGKAVLEDTMLLARTLIGEAHRVKVEAGGIGVGVCELVDLQGNITSDFTVKWRGMPVQDRLSELAPAIVESDVRAHARAEAMLGAGKPYREFVLVTVGTGISACLVQGGVPYPGARGNALVMASSPLTLVSDRGEEVSQVLEEFASGPAIARRFGVERAEDVFAAAQRGDARAMEILITSGEALGNSVAFLVNVLDPGAVIVGGGLGVAGGLYWDRFVASTRKRIWNEDTRQLPILQAALGNDAGIVGAAATAWSKLM